MINTSSKTLQAQEKTQDVKQSPSIKIETKPCVRSRRNEIAEATGRWTGRWKRDRTLDRWLGRQATGRKDRTLAATDRTQERSVRSSTERFQAREIATGHVRWQATGRWQRPIGSSRLQRSGRLDASGQDDLSVRSVAELRESDPNGYFLSGADKYNPQPAI